MAEKELRAEWFWTDRWMTSSAFLLPMEPRGLYREMLTQAWMRGGSLPNDHEAIQRACGATRAEWRRSWPTLERYWRVDGVTLVNDTQLEVMAEARAAADRAAEKARVAANKRWENERARASAQVGAQAHAQASPRAVLEECPPSPSPSPRTTTPPDPPAFAGGPVNGNGHGPRPKAEQEAGVRELIAYWRWLGRCDPRCAGGFATMPQSIPGDRDVRAWRKALKVGRVNLAEFKDSIAARVRAELMDRSVPVWEVEPWPPQEAREASPAPFVALTDLQSSPGVAR